MSLPFDTEKEAVLMERCLHRVGGKRFKRLEGEWFIVYGSWKKLIEQARKMGAGIIWSNRDKYAGICWNELDKNEAKRPAGDINELSKKRAEMEADMELDEICVAEAINYI